MRNNRKAIYFLCTSAIIPFHTWDNLGKWKVYLFLLAGEPYKGRACSHDYRRSETFPRGCLRSRGPASTWRQTLRVSHLSRLRIRAPALSPFPRPGASALRGTLLQPDLDKLSVIFKDCLTSLQKHSTEDDNIKRMSNMGSYCSPGVLGWFLCSETFEDARREHEASEADR